MPTTKRRFDPSVIQQLLDAPYRFQFFQAVRLIEMWLKRNGVADGQALTGHIRFANRVSLGYPASELEALGATPEQVDRSVEGLQQAIKEGLLAHIHITPTFMGFLGGNGALPSHYTERIAAYQLAERDKDEREGPRAFLDTFSNRALALFYQAWCKYRVELQYEAGNKDRFLPLLLSLAGVGHGSLHDRLFQGDAGVQDASLGYFAAALRQRPASAALLQRVLTDYFMVPLTVEQFVGCWYKVPLAHQTKLGSTNATLGTAAMVGERVWQRDLRVRLRFGPLARSDFELFLPGAKAAKALAKMLTMFTGVCLGYEVQVVLRAQDVAGASLGSGRGGGRLGWDMFLATQPEANDRGDVCYEVHTLSE
ncbi:MAG: type VI secretion system baseplate subunit TssG [Rhodoferax sp.]|uniref:type VI secretion system baseplate subunit TssG n=1 Tax=Rhodoferax sp. TaxID=50421 RepID=UPI003265E3CF